MRLETHTDGATTVVAPGGHRRPAEPEGIASWRIVRAAIEGGPAVIGPCPACGLPMIGDPGPSATWTIALPDGVITIADGLITGPSGPLSLDEAEQAIESALEDTKSLGKTAYQTAMFSWIIVWFMVWLMALSCFSLFLCVGVPHGAEFMSAP